MTIFRITLLVLSLSLSGCATKDIFNTTREIDKAGTCRHLKNEFGMTDDVKHITSTKEDVYEQIPSKTFSGIKLVNFHDSKLTLALADKAYFEQYSTPLVDTIHITTYDSHPTRALMATVMYIGIPWLITDHFSDLAFGCTEQKILNTKPDLTIKTKEKTGKSEWRDVQKTHKILISGFDKDYERSISWGEAEYDLSPYILNTDVTKTTIVKIICLDCDLLGVQEQSLYKGIKKTIEITADFRAIKANLAIEDRARIAEQTKRDKEAAAQRVIQAKEDLQRRKESQGVSLNGFKSQCELLGFKLGTAAYGNCVLELNEAK